VEKTKLEQMRGAVEALSKQLDERREARELRADPRELNAAERDLHGRWRAAMARNYVKRGSSSARLKRARLT
jgi:hypothetical protein